MALTYTPTDNLGLNCPDFQVQATDGEIYQLSSFNNYEVLCFLFICNHCPYVQAIEDRIIKLNQFFKNKSVAFIGVCSNDASDYPEDSFDNIKKKWKEKNFGFVYLYDETQKMAKDFGALCTPDIFVFNKMRKLSYRGRFDDSWKDPNKVTQEDLKQAILDTLSQKPISFEHLPSMGCSIKWK
ncbi:MAG: thioredoxin family protein [Bdellovibrionaceae bacterium]|nr:thioredoxin family protein [Pseudobdellovibrionaceae bacterium]